MTKKKKQYPPPWFFRDFMAVYEGKGSFAEVEKATREPLPLFEEKEKENEKDD